MSDREALPRSKNGRIKAVYAAFERDPAIDQHHYPIQVDVEDDVLILKGEVENIVAKRLAPRIAAEVPDVNNIVNRLRVIPSERRGDGAILDSVYQALAQESAFHDYAVVTQITDVPAAGAPRDSAKGIIEVSVDNGAVTLMGDVESLTHRRLAEVLAWWTPGCTDVNNRLHVVPDEQDSDEEITDALRIVLDKDPWLDATQIGMRVRDRVVTLDGLVRSQEQRHMAEYDAWYIQGVHKVINHIEVHS